MNPVYRPYRHFRQRQGAGPVAACVLWLCQLACWVLLPLEGPAWRGAGARFARAYPQFAGRRRPLPGDPVRWAVQSLWLALVRAPAAAPQPAQAGRRTSRTARLRSGVLERASALRQRYVQSLHQAPERLGASATWQELRARGRALDQRRRRAITLGVGALTLLLAALCVTQPFSYLAQFTFVVLLWITAMVIRRIPGRYSTLMLVVLSIAVSCRYLWWRYTATLNWNNSFDLACGVILLLAETYSWLVLMLGYLQVAWPLNRPPAPLPRDPAQWPTVDILIPTYNEDLALVRQTVHAALGVDWPADKLKVYLLDDGRREEFRRFAEAVGVGYIARDDNRHAKAGNLNHALGRIDGELVAIFDSDHMPVRSFLQATVGWFLRDEKLALVQTPHHFFSADPFERNLKVFRNVPNEGGLFYGLVQDGNDLWDAAFFCGSCAVLRREALDRIGGFAVETVTEDAHTSLRLHRDGWRSAYLRIPQAAGLATGSLAEHVNQRIRWARGMAQVFRIDNPLLGRGLSLFQRLCYANAMLHFLSGLPRLVFLTAPLAFLILHVYIIYAPALAIVLFVLPHMIHASLANTRIQRAYRHPFWGEVYETVLAWYIARPTTMALIDPRRGKFNVTAKDELQAADRFDWRVARPYLLLAALNALGLGFALWRLLEGPRDEIGTVVVSSLWVVYNLIIIGGALAVAAEVRQLRRNHRVEVRLPAALRTSDGRMYAGTLRDYSSVGVGIEFAMPPPLDQDRAVTLVLGRGHREFAFPGRVQRRLGNHVGVALDALDSRQQTDFAQCTFARADAWLDWYRGYRPKSLPRSLASVFAMGLRGYLHLGQFLPPGLRRPAAALRRLGRWIASYAPRRPLPPPAFDTPVHTP